MSQIKSKQIGDFNNNVTWTAATSTEIPNSRDVMNSFTPEDTLIAEEFTNQTISSTASVWSLTLAHNVQNNDTALVVLYINGVKSNTVLSVSGNSVTFDSLSYDIDTIDTLEVHYVKEHTV